MKNKILKKWQFKVFVLCWVAYSCIYLGRVNLSIAIPDIQEVFNFSKAQIGFIGSLFFWIYGIGQLVNGYLGDRVQSKIFVFAGLFVTAVSNILFGLSSSFVVMAVLWGINGYFQSMLWGPIAKTLSYWFPFEKRSGVVIAVSTSMVGGYILSWGFSGQILSELGLKWVFLIPGLFIMVFSLIWLFRIKNHPHEVGLELPNSDADLKTQNHKDSTNAPSLWKIICSTHLWYIVAACFAQGIIKDGIGLWAPSFMIETHNLDIKSTAVLILFIPVMNFVGMMLAGWLNKKLKYQEKFTTILLFSFGIIMLMGLLRFGKPNPFIALFFLGLSSAAMYGANTLLLGVIPMNYAKYNKVSSIAGFLDFCSYLASGFASFITGLIVTKNGWNMVMYIWAIVAVIGIISLIISWKHDKQSQIAAFGINTADT